MIAVRCDEHRDAQHPQCLGARDVHSITVAMSSRPERNGNRPIVQIGKEIIKMKNKKKILVGKIVGDFLQELWE